MASASPTAEWVFNSFDTTGTSQSGTSFKVDRGVRIGTAIVTAGSFPMDFHAISTTRGNTWLDVGGTNSGEVQIPAGTYSASQLAAAVQTALQTIDAGYACVYDAATDAFTLSHSTTPFSILGATGTHAELSVLVAIGFQDVDYPALTTFTSDSAPTLGEPDALLVECHELYFGVDGLTPSGGRGASIIHRQPVIRGSKWVHYEAVRDHALQGVAAKPGRLVSGVVINILYRNDRGEIVPADLRNRKFSLEVSVTCDEY